MTRGISACLVFLLVQIGFGQAPKELKTIFEVAGQDSGALLGSYVKGVGDLNKDGYADVAVSAPGKLLTYVYYGGKTMSQKPSLTLAGGGTVARGDFNGDGKRDFVLMESGGGDCMNLFLGQKNPTVKPAAVGCLSSIFIATSVGDVKGDGVNDFGATTPFGVANDNGYFVILSGNKNWVTPVKRQTESAPASNELMQNYPNPFNPGTVISYQ